MDRIEPVRRRQPRRGGGDPEGERRLRREAAAPRPPRGIAVGEPDREGESAQKKALRRRGEPRSGYHWEREFLTG